MCKLNSELVEFIKKNPFLCLNSDIKPRDALFGGRVNASKLYHKCSSDEKIKHYDIRSLYPYVQKYGIFPFGHPKIINSNFESIDKYFGLINCTVLPPRNLLFPILPIKTKNKLLFTLCNKCSEDKLKLCQHCDSDRVIRGTWVSLELNEALKYGYTIINIYQIWHWEQRSKSLFTNYINMFLKYKQESSGIPSNIEEEKDFTKKDKLINEYISEFQSVESILLEKK